MAGARLPRLESWVSRAPLGRGRWMTTAGGFLAVQTLSLLVVAEVQGRAADPDPTVVATALVLGLVGLALCGAGLPLLAHARRVRKWRQRYLLRLQDAKAWFVQGRLAEEDLRTARGPLEEAIEGRFAGESRRTAGDVLRRTGLFLAAWALVASASALRLGEGTAPRALLAAAAVVLLLAAALLARGWPLWRQGKRATADHLERLDEQESRLLAKARDRPIPPETR